MKRAKAILPILDKEAIPITDRHWANKVKKIYQGSSSKHWEYRSHMNYSWRNMMILKQMIMGVAV